MNASELGQRLGNAALAFRGYNVTNLGRTPELLAHAVYGPIVAEELRRFSEVCGEVVGRTVDLEQRVRDQQEASLEAYDEAISLVVAVEHAQLRILKEVFDIDHRRARLSFGYSLGELTAIVTSGVFAAADALRIPLSLAEDCVALAHDTTLAVLFSREEILPFRDVERLCLEINQEGAGVVGLSAILSPNSYLLMGQGKTIRRFRERMKDAIPGHVALRENQHKWPPLHTPIMWQKCIPNRAAQLMHKLPGGLQAPHPPVLSLVTGQVSYNDFNARETLYRWVDQPQRLWDAIYQVLALGIEVVVHLGPDPNIIPATFHRLSDNINAQTKGSFGMRALSEMASRPWLKALLPQRAALLRAPRIVHISLEDWLLSQVGKPAG